MQKYLVRTDAKLEHTTQSVLSRKYIHVLNYKVLNYHKYEEQFYYSFHTIIGPNSLIDQICHYMTKVGVFMARSLEQY